MLRFLYRKVTWAIDSLSLGYPSCACILLVSLETVSCLRAVSLGQERPDISGLWDKAVQMNFPTTTDAGFGTNISSSEQGYHVGISNTPLGAPLESPWCESRVQRSSRRAQRSLSLGYQRRLRNFSLPFPSSKELSQLDWHVWNSVAPEQAGCQQHYTPHPKEHVTPLSLLFFPFAVPTLSLLFFLVDPCR